MPVGRKLWWTIIGEFFAVKTVISSFGTVIFSECELIIYLFFLVEMHGIDSGLSISTWLVENGV